MADFATGSDGNPIIPVDITALQPPSPSFGGNNQWIRRCQLLVTAASETVDLSNLRIRFRITETEAGTYNTGDIRIYNPSDKTVGLILGNTGIAFTGVILQAGYVNGNYGTIHKGTIKSIGHGKENNVDSYLDLFTADGDFANWAVASHTIEGGATQEQQIAALNSTLTPYGIVSSPDAPVGGQTGGILPRGKVQFGSTMDQLRILGKNRYSTFSIQRGALVEIPLQGYLDREIVLINSQTGLIGTPEATPQGIVFTTLLNPKILIGCRVQINNALINQTIVKDRTVIPGTDNLSLYASESRDGVYRVCVHEFEGDTRGNPWFSKCVALSLDTSAPPATAVAPAPVVPPIST